MQEKIPHSKWRYAQRTGYIWCKWYIWKQHLTRMFCKRRRGGERHATDDALCDPKDLLWRLEAHLRRWQVEQPSDGLSVKVSLKFPLPSGNHKTSVQSFWFHFHINLLTYNRLDWRETRGKWLLARNADRRWWQKILSRGRLTFWSHVRTGEYNLLES